VPQASRTVAVEAITHPAASNTRVLRHCCGLCLNVLLFKGLEFALDKDGWWSM
jgi:hypothetical protein